MLLAFQCWCKNSNKSFNWIIIILSKIMTITSIDKLRKWIEARKLELIIFRPIHDFVQCNSHFNLKTHFAFRSILPLVWDCILPSHQDELLAFHILILFSLLQLIQLLHWIRIYILRSHLHYIVNEQIVLQWMTLSSKKITQI